MPSLPDASLAPEQFSGELLKAGTARLAAAGVEAPAREARLLLSLVSGRPPASIAAYPERTPAPGEAERFDALIQRRAGREPLSRILGRREFWSLDFALSAETLDPRPDSETVVEAALGTIGDRDAPFRLLDLGAGTGCLLLALLSECPRATGVGIDLSSGAASAARANAMALGLDHRACFAVARWTEALRPGRFDLIVANPPYVESAAIAGLEPEVHWDPIAALDGGPDGLACYRAMAGDLVRVLSPGGHAVFELGAGQRPAVAAIMEAAGMGLMGCRADLAGHDRALVLRAPLAAPALLAEGVWQKRVGTTPLPD